MQSVNNDARELVFYDISGIQNFIFSNKKLLYNIGASNLVEDLFSKETLNKIIIEITKEPLKTIKELNNFSDIEYNDAYLVSNRGGNALFLFGSHEKSYLLTKKLANLFLETTGNELGLNVAYQKTNFEDFSKDMAILIENISRCKNSYAKSKPISSFSINELKNDKTAHIHKIINSKDRTIEKITYIEEIQKDYKDNIVKKKLELENWNFPKDLNQLRYMENEKKIAFIHIDGNDFGLINRLIIKNSNSYLQALKNIFDLNNQLEKIYIESIKETINDLIDKMENFIKLGFIDRNSNNFLPIRPIILAGDDITFISNGKIALWLTSTFMERLSTKSLIVDNRDYNHSACGGILITHYKFPFDRAYKYLEQVSNFAKLKGKIKANFEFSNTGFWLDIQVIKSGINSSSLISYRQKNLRNKFRSDPKPISSISYPNIKLQQFSLTSRPWCVISDGNNDQDNFNNILFLSEKLQKLDKNQREKLKKSLFLSIDKYKKVREELIKNNPELINEYPNLFDNIFQSNLITNYLDAIELLDFYPLNLGGNTN